MCTLQSSGGVLTSCFQTTLHLPLLCSPLPLLFLLFLLLSSPLSWALTACHNIMTQHFSWLAVDFSLQASEWMGDVVWCPVILFFCWLTGGSRNYAEGRPVGLFIANLIYPVLEKLYGSCRLYLWLIQGSDQGDGTLPSYAEWVTGRRRCNWRGKEGKIWVCLEAAVARGGAEGGLGGVMLQRDCRGESQILTLENHLYDNNYLTLSPSLSLTLSTLLLLLLSLSLSSCLSLSLFHVCPLLL